MQVCVVRSSRRVEVLAILFSSSFFNLFLSATTVLFKFFALWHRTVVVHALFGVNLQQCPRFAAERATTGRLNLARKGVVEKLLNLGAVRVIAWVLSACDGVQQKLHGTIDLRLSTLSLSLRDGGAIADGATLPHEWMLVTDAHAAGVANVEVRARLAAPPLARLELSRAHVARSNERRLGRIVEVIQHHHG